MEHLDFRCLTPLPGGGGSGKAQAGLLPLWREPAAVQLNPCLAACVKVRWTRGWSWQ